MKNKKKLILVIALAALLVAAAVVACLFIFGGKDQRTMVTFQGVEEIHAPVGAVTEESLLAGVTAVDANGKNKKVTVNLGDADLSKPGRYMIEYKAGDAVKKELVFLYGDISFLVNGQRLEGDKVEIDFATAITSLHFAKTASATDSFGNKITAKLVEGDKFDYAVGEYTAKYTATDKAGQTVEKTVTYVVTSNIEMTVQSGVSVKYEQDSVTFKVDLDGEKDVWLMANGGLVSIADYTVTEKGLELKASYFRTLPPGENTLKICSVNGSTEFTFTVVDTGKPIFSFDSLYKTYIITGDAAVYEMPQAQIASHEYTYTFKVTKDGVAYKAEQIGDSVVFTTSAGKNLSAGIYDVTVTATNKADTSKKTTITRDFRIYTNQTEIDGWEFWNAPQAATMPNVDLSDMGYFRTSWKYDAKSTASWDSRVQWLKAKPKTFQSITFDFYVYSLGIAEKENGPVKYVGKNGKADILFNALTMGGESLAFMFYDSNGKVVPQDELKMNTWYTMKLDVAEFGGEETDIFMVTSMNNVRKVGMYITDMHFWAYEGSGTQNVFRDDAKTATIQRNSGKSDFVSATLDNETVWMYSVTEKHMPSTALKRSLKVNTSKTKEVISIDFKFMEDPKDAWGKVLKPTMFVHDLDYPQKDIAYGANYTLVDAETGKPVETPEVGKWYTLYITTKGRENFLIYPMGETKDPVTCKVAFKNLQTYDVDLGNAQVRTDLGNVSRVSLFKNGEGKWQYSYVSYTGWSKTYPNDTWRRRAVVSTTGDVSKVTFEFKFELSEYLEKGKETAVDNFALFAGVEDDKHPKLVTVIYDQNGNPAGESDIVSGQWYYAVVTREDGKKIVNPFNLLIGGYANGGDGNIVNIEMELRDLQGVASTAEKLTIDFNLNYENAPDYNETLTVAPYTTYGELPVPEQREDGQYFNGWFKDAACTEAVIDSMLVTESHTLYAKWGDRPLLNVTFTYPDYGTYYAEVFTSKQGTDTIHKYASTMPNDAGRWHEGVYAEHRRVTMNIADELGDTIVMDVMIESVTDVDGNALDTSTLTIYPAGSNAAREVIYTDAEGNPVDANALVVGQWYTATFTGVGAQSYDIYPFALGEAGGGEKGIFYMKNIKLIPGETPDTPDEDDFNPTLRFAITSDMHLFNRYQGSDPQEARLANVFKVSYNYAKQSTYNKLDAVLVAGDISEGDAGEFVMFKDIVDANIQEGTQLIVGMGNHDFRGGLEPSAWTEDAAKKLEAAFKETFGLESADQHVVIGGYHFISLSPNAENLGNNVGESYSEAKLAWLEAEIQEAIADDATKPVFVMQHHHASGTVYGSGAAGGKQAGLYNLLSKYPQVVDFSGHSHYPVNDPRNVWQGAFTAIGTGTLYYTGFDINGGPSGVSPDGYQGDYSTSGSKNGADYGVFQIIELNADNDIRVIVYDLRSFEELSRFVIPNPVENKDFKIEQAVPEFAEDTDIYYEDGYIYVQQAVSEDIIESYRVEVYEGDKFIGTYYGLSGYVYPKQLQPEYVRIKVGELAENKGYTVKVYAVNVYGEKSDALVFVTAEPDTKVIFDLDYEGAPAPEEVLLVGGKVFGTLPRPNRTEYAFGGWFTEKNGAGEQITADTIVEGECTLYAYWFVPTEPKPSFDAVLGTAELDARYGVLPDPTLQYLDEWVYVYDGNAKDYSMYTRFLKITFGNSITENKFTLKAKITNVNGGSTAYTACGSGLVSIFDSEGKTVAENLVNGKSVGLKADEWYTFVYTKTDGSAYKPGDWSHLGGFGAGRADIHIKDVAFEKYDIEGLTFEVTFNLNHEGAADPAVVKVAGGKTVGDKLPTPEREGYKFNGWSTSKWGWGMGKAFAADTAVSGNQTVYAMWTIDPEVFGYTFSYPSAEGTYYLNTSVAELDDETVIKYTTTSNNHSGVTAYYRRAMLHIDNVAGQEIVVKMMAPAGASSAQTKLAVHNAAGTALDITITNASGEKVDALVAGQWCTVTFIGDGSDNYQIRPFDGGGTSGTLYIKDAKAEEIPVNEVKLDLNYEGAEAPATINVVAGNAYGKLPTPRRTDYAFGGWYKTADCTGEAVKATDIVSADHTLYAKWFVPTEPKPNLDATVGPTSVGAGVMSDPTLHYVGDAWTYVFDGNSKEYGMYDRFLKITLGETVPETEFTLKAMITNVNGGSTGYTACGDLSVKILDAEGNVVAENLTNGSPTKTLNADEWYTFVYTETAKAQFKAGTWYHLGGFGAGYADIYIKDIDLGVSGEETTYEVTFDLNYEGAGEGPAKITREEGAAYGTLPSPKRTDYAFGGWYKTADCTGEAVTADTIVSKSHTLYAKWFVPTDPKPTMDATLTTFTGFTSAGTIHQPTLEYIDGEWVYVYVGSDVAYSAAQRYLRIDVGASVQESKMSMKVKLTNVSGTDTTYVPCGSLSVQIYDLNGNVVAADALQADVWYTFVHTSGGMLAGDWWHLGGFGSGTGTMDIYIKDIVFGEREVEEPTTHDVTFDLNFPNQTAITEPAGIVKTYTEGQFYKDALPELTRAAGQIPYSLTGKAAHAAYELYYTFGGWYTDEACTNALDVNAEVTEATTVYAKWIAGGFNTRYLDTALTLFYSEEDGTFVNKVESKGVDDNYVMIATIPNSGVTVKSITFKAKLTGTKAAYKPASNNRVPTITNLDGSAADANNLTPDQWYNFTWDFGNGWAGPEFTNIGFFDCDGEFYYFKDFKVNEDSKLSYTVSFDLNYEGATNAPAAITVAEGAAYGTLPTPTRAQTPVTTSDGYTFYYSFAGWHLDADCTGEAVKPTDVADKALTLYAKWIKAGLMPRAANSVYSDPTLQYIDNEWVYVYANNGTARSAIEQERLNLHLPEKIAYAVSYKVMLTNETNAALFYIDSGNLGVDVYDPNGNLLYSRNYKNGGTTTQVTLEEGKWYTVVHSNRDSSTYYDAGQNYFGVGAFSDGAGGATVYVKDISIATEALSADGAYFYSRVTTALADKKPRYIDGEWTWAYIGNNLSSSWANRILYLVVNEPNVETVTCKIMMNNCTGAAVPRYYRGASAHASIWDENGTLIAEKVALGGQVALEAGKWYTFEFGVVSDATNNQLTVDVAKEWNAIYCGDGTGGMDVYVKDIEVH